MNLSTSELQHAQLEPIKSTALAAKEKHHMFEHVKHTFQDIDSMNSMNNVRSMLEACRCITPCHAMRSLLLSIGRLPTRALETLD